MPLRFTASMIDVLAFLCLAIWLLGGIPHGEARPWLSHGADMRRAALLLWLGAYALPAIRVHSVGLRGVAAIARSLGKSHWRWRLWGVTAIWAAVLVTLQALALRFPLWDAGIFHQILWSFSQGHGFWSSISGAGNFLTDHFAPALALLAPAFWLSDSGIMMGILHVFCLFIGTAAWIRLAERAPGASKEIRQKLAAATAVFAVTFDSLWANLHWGFHENAPAFAALSWAFYFIFAEPEKPQKKDKYAREWREYPAFALLLVAAACKEILLLDVAVVLIVWFASPLRPRSRGLAAVLLPTAFVCFGAFIAFEHLPHPEGKNYFIRYYSYLGKDLSEVFQNAGKAPLLILETIGIGKLATFALTIMLPWMALPLLGYRGLRRWLSVVLPSAAAMALSTYDPLRSAGFHYVLELWPLLAALTVLVLARRGNLIWPWALLSVFLLSTDPWQQALEYAPQARAQSELRSRLREIPRDDSVLADEMTGTWLASRRELARYPELGAWSGGCPSWFVITAGAAEGRVPGVPSVSDLYAQCRTAANSTGLPAQLPTPVWTTAGWVAYKLRQ